MVTVVPRPHDEDMIWWVLGAAVFVIIGLVYVMRHESEFCGEHPAERFPAEPPMSDTATQWRKAA